ncbi:MAG: hypothetical protein KDK70_40545, partial [Myxococcales bacterium]|nr:hypothetical protein [Myxococcales bacterium]
PRADRRAAAPPAEPKPAPAASSPPKGDSVSVECVLDPSRCRTGESPTPSPRPGAGTDAPLPAKLSAAQLKQALATTKAEARRCGPAHGGEPGTKVEVKLSIDGPTGAVISATPRGEHATGALGRCVAEALGRTEFPRFGAARMGTLYSVRL